MLGGGSWVGASASGADSARITVLEDKYVRTTRFALISSGTSGTVTLPTNSTVVLDDFGGTVDAIISKVTSSKPNLQNSYTSEMAIVATSFDSSGNYALTGTPTAYSVAIIYRVRQKLIDFDSTASDILGDPDFGAYTYTPASNLDFPVLSRGLAFYEDFMNQVNPFVSTTSGAGSISNPRAAKSTIDHPGVWSLQTGTTTSGYASLISSNQDDNLAIGGGLTTFEAIVSLTTLGNVTDNYDYLAGIRSAPYTFDVSPGDGIYFSYKYSVNGGNWTFNGTKTGIGTVSRDTGIPVVADQFYRLTWILNAAGTSVQAYVDGVACGDAITTTIPATTKKMGLFYIVKKSAGTTNVVTNLDATSFSIILNTPR